MCEYIYLKILLDVTDLTVLVFARFECPKLENDGKCHVNGNSYNVNEKLSDSDEPLCSAACYCAQTME